MSSVHSLFLVKIYDENIIHFMQYNLSFRIEKTDKKRCDGFMDELLETDWAAKKRFPKFLSGKLLRKCNVAKYQSLSNSQNNNNKLC